MSSSPRFSPNSGKMSANLEEHLRSAAAAFPYPQTPDLAGRWLRARQERRAPAFRPNRLAVGLILLLILVAAALLVSPVRARVLDWIRIGAVRIFFTQPTPTPVPPLPTGTPAPGIQPTSEPTPTVLKSVLDLSGETTLSQAQEQAGFTILMPSYPTDLGSPEHVFLQKVSRPVVVLVWTDPNQAGKVRMSLSESASDQVIFEKYAPRSVQDTQVGGHAAVWIDGDYLLVTRNGDMTLTRLITQSHTLIWMTGEMTFRLETDVDLETAIRIAQSIR